MQHNEPTTGIAITGMSCRMPGAKDPASYWDNLYDGVEAVKFLKAEDLIAAGLDPAMLQHPGYVNAAIRLEDVDLFDATFFGFSPREAELLDPQQRLFLECAWEALENAGCDAEQFPGLIGVYAGVNGSHYAFNLYANQDLMRTMGMFQISMANDKDHISTRVAYKLNLHGPAITVQTTCSTSLVAICQACQSLLNYQCDVALAGASSILLNQNGYIYQEDGIPSPDGHCRAFDAMAKGTIGGSGVGVVALKRLDDALADGDPIHAVIRGFAVNNDGSVKVGYTAPSIDGQAEVISMALAMGAIDPETISYVETHGTGTPLGDPIEVTALTKAYREAGASRNQYCRIGSVKSNIGHLDPAAGVAGLMKTVLALQHRTLPPSLHFKQPNPNIDFANSPFYVNATRTGWPTAEKPRRAGVSSFGIGGTNAHVVLEEAPVREAGTASRPWQLLMVSARSSTGVDTTANNLASWLQDNPDITLGDVAWTLQTGRKVFDWRRVVLCSEDGRKQTIATLKTASGAIAGGRGGAPQVAFLFSGQGSQYLHMAAELYQNEPVFRESFDACAEILRPHLDDDLRNVIYPDTDAGVKAEARLTQTNWAQPALFVIEYSLTRLWQHWGIKPQALAGHSVGEFVAACIADVFSLQDALDLVAARGRLMQSMPPGAMLSVMLAKEQLEQQLPENISIAAINAPGATVVSGAVDAIDSFQQQMEAQSINCQRLHTSHAFHSQMMEPILEAFAEQVRRATLRPPQLPFLSNVTGDWITPAQATDPLYWASHIRAPVRFLDNVRQLLSEPSRLLLEVGPGRMVASFASQVAERPGDRAILNSLPHPKDRQTDTQNILGALGRLWQHGLEVNWESFYEGERRRRVCLPTYPFERQRFWVDLPKPGTKISQQVVGTSRRDLSGWLYAPKWERAAAAENVLAEALATEPRIWLILGDTGSMGSAVAALLTKHNQRVIQVQAGKKFRVLETDAFEIDPVISEDYVALFAEIEKNGPLPQYLLDLSCYGTDSEAVVDGVNLSGFFSLLYLANALSANRLDQPIEIVFAADHLHAYSPDATPIPSKAAMLGLLRVIPQECPGLRCRSIDIQPSVDDGSVHIESIAQQLVTEIVASPFEPAVAVRLDERRVERWRTLRLRDVEGVPPRLRERGTYLITGGLGQIGLKLAGLLANTVRARLVLIGRTPLPPRWQWDDLTQQNPDDLVSAQIARLLELERQGAEIMVLTADIADTEQMGDAINRATESFGPINGVIHAAGYTTAAARPLTEIDASYAQMHFRPKVEGLQVLDRLLEAQPLDFVILMSSLSSVLGGLGFGAYAAANAYLDAYAVSRNQDQFAPWICLNWDGWDFSGGPEGDYLLPGEGVEVLRRILHRRIERAAISVTPLNERLRKWVYLEALPTARQQRKLDEETATTSSVSHHDRPNLSSTYIAGRNDTESAILEVWEDLLGISPIGVDDNYFELGGHSLLAIQVASRLCDQLQVKVSVQALFESPTVAELAQRIEQERDTSEDDEERLKDLLSHIEQLSDEEVQELLGEESN